MTTRGNPKLSVFLETSILTISRALLYKENTGKWICCFGLLCCYFPMLIEDNGTPSYQHACVFCTQCKCFLQAKRTLVTCQIDYDICHRK